MYQRSKSPYLQGWSKEKKNSAQRITMKKKCKKKEANSKNRSFSPVVCICLMQTEVRIMAAERKSDKNECA